MEKASGRRARQRRSVDEKRSLVAEWRAPCARKRCRRAWVHKATQLEVDPLNEEQCGVFAADLLQASCERLGRAAGERVLHSDNGKPMKGSSMLAMMQTLGIVPSFSRPHVSDDNPYIESIFRTLKYRPGEHGTRFDTVEEAAAWVERFVRWYNHEHLHSGIGFVTPADRHEGRDIAILDQRRTLYGHAQSAHPERWTRAHRAWKRPSEVLLLPNIHALKLDPLAKRVA